MAGILAARGWFGDTVAQPSAYGLLDDGKSDLAGIRLWLPLGGFLGWPMLCHGGNVAWMAGRINGRQFQTLPVPNQRSRRRRGQLRLRDK